MIATDAVSSEKLSRQESLDLLVDKIPELTKYETRQMDYDGMCAWRKREPSRGYRLKMVAARNFERLAMTENNPRLWEEAALSYDKCSKNAAAVGCIMAAIRCRIRACLLHHKYLEHLTERYVSSHDFGALMNLRKTKEHLDYSRSYILSIISLNSADEIGGEIMRSQTDK